MYSTIKRLILISSFVLLTLSCANNSSQNAKQERNAITVKVLSVKVDTSFSANSYIGSARAAKSRIIYSRNSGTIEELNIRRGDKITKDQVIAKIDAPNIISANRIAQASLNQAQDGYKRAKAVEASGSISEVKMIEIQSKLEQAKASADAAKSALEDCKIKAPFEAYVEEVFVEEAQKVDIAQSIAKIVAINEIEICFDVPENEIASLKENQELTIDIAAADKYSQQAVLATKGISGSDLSHSYTCIAILEKSDPIILPGMVCKIRKSLQEQSVVIPADIIQLDVDSRYVWVVENGQAFKRVIEIDGFVGNGVKVVKGLKEGDLLIVEGFQKVSTGMQVTYEE